MKNNYIKHFTLLASLVFGATGVFAQETNSDCDIDSPKEEHLQYTRNVNNLESLDPDRFVQNLNPDYDLVWYTTDDPSKEPNSLGREKMTFDRSEAGSYLFYIAYKDGDCYSERARVEVEVLAAPVPQVRNIDLCKDGTYDAMDGIVSTDEPDFELIWFIDPTDTVGNALTTPPTNFVDVTTPGKYTLYVAQRMKTYPYAQSDIVSFDVIVYGVMPPIDASKHEYCAHDAAEPLKAIKQENLLNYYGADDVWFKFGATEYEAVLPDTRVNSTMTYDYEAYQKFRIPMTGEVCIGPSIDIEVKVVAVGRPIFKGNVIYDKNEAIDTKEFQDILTKYPDAIEIVEGQTLLWSREKDGTYIKGSSPSSKPTYDIMLTSQGVQERWVKWEVQTESGLVCQSEPSEINITIISSSVPIVKDVEICENDYLAGAINLEDFASTYDYYGNIGQMDYQLYWYTDKAKAEAAIKNGPSEGSTTAPALNTLVDISSDQMRSSWEGEVYVVQSNGISTSAASRIRITVNATPRLLAMPHGPVCMGPVDLTSSEYWVIDNGITSTVQYTFNGSVVENQKAITQSGEYEITATSPYGCVSDPLKLQVDILNISTDIEFESMSVCAGDAIVLDAAVVSAGAKVTWKVTWYDEEGNPLGVNPGPVVPEFKGSADMPTYKYTYYAEPYSDIITCPSKRFPLSVEVYRPLEGALEDQTICKGQTVRIDAGSYGATTYIWIVYGDTIPGGRYFQATPEKDTEYQVLMTRGICKAEDKTIVNVLSNPVILSIDSIDVREREVILAGTYQLRVDDGEWMNNTSLTNLSDGLHTLYVQDSNGCSTSETFIVNQTNDVANIFADRADEIINVYTITGALVKSNVKRSEALNGLANGIYMIGGDKVIVNK